MRIGLYANPDKDRAYQITSHAAALIHRMGAVGVIGYQYQDTPLAAVPGVELGEYGSCDRLICLGGDGTFLSAVHLPGCEDIPIIGVNLGSVGFLHEIMPEHLEEALDQLINGSYNLEQRMMLEVACYDTEQNLIESGFALNDAVISRGGKSRILTLDLMINQERVDRIPGDGVIVSTPTGSTAYSLSAGGPIIHPELQLLLITPICPHTLHNRSYIATDSSRVVVRIGDYPYQALLAIDGRQEIDICSGWSVVITKSERTLKLIRLGHDHFYATLPQKIHARGKTL
ncbi:MAG: NAD(+)/NADH kinase [Clostridiaceae bacterium]|nr:NAD(+)/NADH kinase [Clostridiaceae bacterium]